MSVQEAGRTQLLDIDTKDGITGGGILGLVVLCGEALAFEKVNDATYHHIQSEIDATKPSSARFKTLKTELQNTPHAYPSAEQDGIMAGSFVLVAIAAGVVIRNLAKKYARRI